MPNTAFSSRYPRHKMESSSPSQSKRYRYGTQGYLGGFHCFQEGQYGNIRAESFPTSTYQLSPCWETASWKPSSLSSNKLKVSITMPETGLDTRCMGYDGSSNGFPNFSAGSNPMLPPTKPHATRDDQQRKGNDALSYMPMQVAMGNSPSMLGFQAHWAPDIHVQSEFPGFPGLDDIGSWNEGFPMPVNDPWLMNPPVTQSVPLKSGDSHAEQFHTLDRGILDMPQWAREPPMSLATSMPGHFSDTSPDNSLPSYDLYSPFLSLQDDMEDIPLPSFPGNQPLDYTSHSSNSLSETRSDSNPIESDGNISSSVLEPTKVLRNILPMPPRLPSDAVSDTNSNDGTQQGCTKLGRRRCLTGDEKEETARMRQMGSCAMCIVRKIKCTEEIVCAPCQNMYSQRTLEQAPICPRGRLDQYKDDFFSPFIVAHLEQGAVQNLMSNVQFFNDKIRVLMSLGPSYPSLSLEICEFRTAIEKLSHVPDLASKTNDHLMTFTPIATLQYGIPSAAIGHLRQTCLYYVEDISNCMNISMGSSKITREAFDTIRRFQQASRPANQDNLLRMAIQITTIYHLLARRFLFTEDSPLETAGMRSNSSKVVNRQIKAALHVLLKKLVPEALLELDGRLRHQKKETWASCLCALLLLCTCVEQIQVVVDAFVLSKLSSEGGDPARIRQRGFDISHGLERTIGHLQILLDGLLKGIIKKHNPFKASVQMKSEAGPNEVGLSEAEIMLTNELRQITDEHKEEIMKRAKNNYFGSHSQNIGDHKMFRASNDARLVCRVLRRLC